MGEKEHFLLGCFYTQYSLGVSNTGESEKTLQSLGQKIQFSWEQNAFNLLHQRPSIPEHSLCLNTSAFPQNSVCECTSMSCVSTCECGLAHTFMI